MAVGGSTSVVVEVEVVVGALVDVLLVVGSPVVVVVVDEDVVVEAGSGSVVEVVVGGLSDVVELEVEVVGSDVVEVSVVLGVSGRHSGLHPSPATRLPSSQVSPRATSSTPLPHVSSEGQPPCRQQARQVARAWRHAPRATRNAVLLCRRHCLSVQAAASFSRTARAVATHATTASLQAFVQAFCNGNATPADAPGPMPSTTSRATNRTGSGWNIFVCACGARSSMSSSGSMARSSLTIIHPRHARTQVSRKAAGKSSSWVGQPS